MSDLSKLTIADARDSLRKGETTALELTEALDAWERRSPRWYEAAKRGEASVARRRPVGWAHSGARLRDR